MIKRAPTCCMSPHVSLFHESDLPTINEVTEFLRSIIVFRFFGAHTHMMLHP